MLSQAMKDLYNMTLKAYGRAKALEVLQSAEKADTESTSDIEST